MNHKKYPNYKWAFCFGMVFIVFFALAMQLLFLDPSSKAYKVIKSFDNFWESLEYTKDGSIDANGNLIEVRRDNRTNVIRGVRSYTFVTWSLIFSSISLLGLSYNISPTKTLAPFKKSFKKIMSNK